MIDLGGQGGAPVLGLGGGMFKASIILFDTRPGTKQFTVPEGVKKIRAFVVGAGGVGGGGYSEKVINVVAGQVFAYTVGAGSGGSSAFGGLISATGGAYAGGVGSGGDVNFNGGAGTALSGTVLVNAGGSAANRYENGKDGDSSTSSSTKCFGASFTSVNGIDGWGLGMPPGSYGWGGFWQSDATFGTVIRPASMGGGGSSGYGMASKPGIGGGATSGSTGGNGAVGVEVLA